MKAGASNGAGKNALLAIAGEKPGLWDGLEEADDFSVLKQATSTTGTLHSRRAFPATNKFADY